MATRRRGRTIILLILVLLLLLVLAFAAWIVFLQPMLSPRVVAPVSTTPGVITNAPQPTATEVVNTVDIVMTTQQMPRGATITESVVTLVPIPSKDYVQGTFFEKLEDVVGKRAKYNMQPGTPLTSALLIGDKGSASAFDIAKGMVAISMPIGKLSTVSYGLQPGDHVNVITSLELIDLDQQFQSALPNSSAVVTLPGDLAKQFTATVLIGVDPVTNEHVVGRTENDSALGSPVYVYPSEKQRPRLVSQTLIQDVTVLQVGIFPQGEPIVGNSAETTAAQGAAAQPAQTGQAAQPAPQQTIPVPDVITLIVSPQDAVTLNYLMLAGAKINLVMRSAGDSDVVDTSPVTLPFILDQYKFPNPAKVPYGMQPRSDEVVPANNIIQPFPDTGTAVPFLTNPTPLPNRATPVSPALTPTAEPNPGNK